LCSASAVIEQHFGESAPWSLGVEEELMLVDAETLEPGQSACAEHDQIGVMVP